MKSKLLAVAAAVLFASVANAATVLDFEDGTDGSNQIHHYIVGGAEIIFANALYVNMTGALPAGMAITQDNPSAPIVVTFSEPVLGVSALARGAMVAGIQNRLRAYGPGDVFLAMDSQTAIQQDHENVYAVVLSVFGLGIVKVELEGQNGGFSAYFDELTVTPTPLPAALPLFATGLGALGLLGWRRKRKAAAVA